MCVLSVLTPLDSDFLPQTGRGSSARGARRTLQTSTPQGDISVQKLPVREYQGQRGGIPVSLSKAACMGTQCLEGSSWRCDRLESHSLKGLARLPLLSIGDIANLIVMAACNPRWV